jgi:hypothetical protein
LAAAFAAVALVWSRSDVIPSASGDLALHYALIKEFLDFGRRTELRPYLGELNYYPPLAHWAVAHLARYVGPLRAISITSIVSVFVVYASLCLMVVEGARRRTLMKLAIFFALVRLFALWQIAAGYEIVWNFFFPQIFGDALAFASAVAIARFTPPLSWLRSLLVLMALWLIAYSHLIPAVFFLVTFGVLFVIDAGMLLQEGGRDFWREHSGRTAMVGLSYVAIAAMLLFLHPSFSLMRRLSDHNGDLSFRIGPQTIALMVLSFALVILPTMAWLVYRRAWSTAFERLLLAMASASVLLLAFQFGAFRLFGMGSPYAVKKHLFHAFTIGALAIAAVVTEMLQLRGQRNSSAVKQRLAVNMNALTGASLALIAAALMVGSFYPRHSPFDWNELVRLRTVAAHLPIDKIVLPADYSLPNSLNYLVAIGDRRMRRKIADNIVAGKYDQILNLAVSGGIRLDYVITDTPARFYDLAALVPSTKFVTYADTRDGYVVVNPHEATLLLNDGTVIRMGRDTPARNYLLSGWAAPEKWGVWSDGALATLVFRVQPAGDYSLTAELLPFAVRKRPEQAVRIKANGKLVWEGKLASPADIPIPLHVDNDLVARVDFEIANPASPRELGISNDERKLGVELVALKLVKRQVFKAKNPGFFGGLPARTLRKAGAALPSE